METIRLLFFTTLWTAIWGSPLPKLARGVELVAGLTPVAATGKTLGLALDGSYLVQQGSTILESGSYSMAYAGSNVYTLTGNNGVIAAELANLPNQNDSHTVAGNALTRLKYDPSGGGYNLRLKLDGTDELLDGFTVVDTGSYAIAVPEPTSAAMLQTTLLLVCPNVFMAFAWYAHLKDMSGRPWFVVADSFVFRQS